MVKLRDPSHVKVGTNDHSHGKKCLSPSFVTTLEGGRTVSQNFIVRVSTPLAGFYSISGPISIIAARASQQKG